LPLRLILTLEEKSCRLTKHPGPLSLMKPARHGWRSHKIKHQENQIKYTLFPIDSPHPFPYTSSK
jgi:hypothetical protein